MRKFLASLASLMRRIFSWVWDPLKRTSRMVFSTVAVAATGVGHAADAALSLPGALARSVLGIHTPVPTEQQAENRATVAGQEAKLAADRSVEDAELGNSVRQAIRRLWKGLPVPEALAERLPPPVLTYLRALRTDELRVLSATPVRLVVAHLAGERQSQGVRSMAEVRSTPAPAAPAPSAPDTVQPMRRSRRATAAILPQPEPPVPA